MINFGKPKVNPKTQAKNIPLWNAVDRCNLKISTPLVTCWGAEGKDFEGNGNIKYSMSLSIPTGEYATPETDAFHTNMRALEVATKKEAIKNSMAWFNKPSSKMTDEVLDAIWSPMLKYKKDPATGEPDYTASPSLNVKIPFWDGKFSEDIELYDIDGNLLYPGSKSIVELIPKGTEVSVIMQSGGVYLSGGKFGITWKLFQGVIKPKFKLAKGVCHIKISNEQKKAPTMQLEGDNPDDEPVKPPNTQVADSDEEQDPEQDYKLHATETGAEPSAEPSDTDKKKKREKKK
jgi:hypothetical protein